MKSLIRNPILVVGVLLFSVFLMNTFGNKSLLKREKLIPSSCKAALVMLDRRIPGNWKATCENNSLNLIIESTVKTKPLSDMNDVRKLVYRELANSFVFLAKNSPTDNLERTDYVSIRYVHPKLEVGAFTKGKFVTKFSTIQDQEMMKKHLQSTVQIKELIK